MNDRRLRRTRETGERITFLTANGAVKCRSEKAEVSQRGPAGRPTSTTTREYNFAELFFCIFSLPGSGGPKRAAA